MVQGYSTGDATCPGPKGTARVVLVPAAGDLQVDVRKGLLDLAFVENHTSKEGFQHLLVSDQAPERFWGDLIHFVIHFWLLQRRLGPDPKTVQASTSN